jgi:hypothetical protein
MGRWLLLLLLGTSGLARADAPPCPATATITVQAENSSPDETVSLQVDGELLDEAATCAGAGTTSYAATVTCTGHGTVRCGEVGGLRPGAWVHRVQVQVTGSDEQRQSRRAVVLASGPGVSNVVGWTIFPRTFVVRQADGDDLLHQLDMAAAFTASSPDARALVTFDPDAFPGAASPTQVNVAFRRGPPRSCDVDTCVDGKKAARCLYGSRVTVDALDRRGERGGVVLVNGTCERYLLRIYGSDNVLRGLELLGTESTVTVDTLALVGADAQRNRIEQCVVRGGMMADGDALSVGDGAGMPGGAEHDAVIVDSEITGAQDKGIKVVGGGHATIATSCIHDNLNGGIQATEGGHVTAVRNVVQLNRLGPSQNGLLVGVPDEIGDPNTMTTDGNVVRFSGARGISVVNAGTALFTNDFVAENAQAGIRVESTMPGPTPAALLRGVGLACNHKRVAGECFPDSTPCTQDSACASFACEYPPDGEPDGFGLSAGFGLAKDMDVCAGGGCSNPVVDLGRGGRDAGRNALAQNRNPARNGVELSNELAGAAPPIPARGNQWQDCGDAPMCNVSQVQAVDLRPAGTTAADIGTPTGAGGGPPPAIVRIVPARPRSGDFVRVYNGSLDGNGGTFNAVDGVACTEPTPMTGDPDNPGEPVGLPSDPCSPASPEIASQNRTVGRGNRVTITLGGGTFDADVHAVTPTMLVFQMPVDCFASGTLTVTRGNDAPSAAVTFCDPSGCGEQSPGAPCDDGNVCTLGERCDGNGACVPASSLDCSGVCQTGTCDPQAGCVPLGDGAPCNDGNACTDGDQCSGTACVPGSPRNCTGPCLTGACDSGTGCVPQPASTPCDDGTICTVGDHCTGTDGSCVPGAPRACDDGNPCTTDACDPASGCTHVAVRDGSVCPASDHCHGPAQCRGGACDPGPEIRCNDGNFCTDDRCDPAQGCVFPPATGVRRTGCRIDELRALLGGLPDSSAARGRRLAKRLDRAEGVLAKAEAATRPKQIHRHLLAARRVFQGFLGAVRRGRDILGATLERQLVRSAKTAIASLKSPAG